MSLMLDREPLSRKLIDCFLIQGMVRILMNNVMMEEEKMESWIEMIRKDSITMRQQF